MPHTASQEVLQHMGRAEEFSPTVQASNGVFPTLQGLESFVPQCTDMNGTCGTHRVRAKVVKKVVEVHT